MQQRPRTANQQSRIRSAQQTLSIIERGHYNRHDNDGGGSVHLKDSIDFSVANTVHYRANANLEERVQAVRASRQPLQTVVEVTDETTLAACRRLCAVGNLHHNVAALNFASAKNPGGGFLTGAQAQEESLARGSTLYASLIKQPAFYTENRRCRTCLYTHQVIYTPSVAIIRDDRDFLLDSPSHVAFITSPAVNTNALTRNEPAAVGQIEKTMLSRMRRILDIALIHGHDTLVLGAWGCGVFGNAPQDVARWFARLLTQPGAPYQGLFKHITFAIYDPSHVALEAFRRRFAA